MGLLDQSQVFLAENQRFNCRWDLIIYRSTIGHTVQLADFLRFLKIFKDFFQIYTIQPTKAQGFNTLFIQYYSVICRSSDHIVGRPRAEIRTRDGRSRGRDSDHWTTIRFFVYHRQQVGGCESVPEEVPGGEDGHELQALVLLLLLDPGKESHQLLTIHSCQICKLSTKDVVLTLRFLDRNPFFSLLLETKIS